MRPSTIISILALFFAISGAGYATVTSDPQITQLKRQVTSLKTQVKSDEAAFTALREYALCQDGIIWDSISQTWYSLHGQVNRLRQAAPSWPDYAVSAGTAGISSFDDQGACQALGIHRPASIIVNP